MVEKARRSLEGEATGQDRLWPYQFGVHDPADRQLLRFLGLTNDDVLDVLRREPDNAAAAAELVRRSGRTPPECAAWSDRFRRWNTPFLAMIDADEGRREPGLSTTLLRYLYNRVIMPPTDRIYRRMEQRRLTGGAPGLAGDQAYPRLLVLLAVGGGAAGAIWWRIARNARRRRTWREQVADRTREAAGTVVVRASHLPELVADVTGRAKARAAYAGGRAADAVEEAAAQTAKAARAARRAARAA
jgi:hypothetical protein